MNDGDHESQLKDGQRSTRYAGATLSNVGTRASRMQRVTSRILGTSITQNGKIEGFWKDLSNEFQDCLGQRIL